jgi:hypothetical protein
VHPTAELSEDRTGHRAFARPSQLRAPDVEVRRALNRSAVAVLIITSISRVRAAGVPSPDPTVDTSRCTTREFSRTVIFRCVKSAWMLALMPYDDYVSSAVVCWAGRC